MSHDLTVFVCRRDGRAADRGWRVTVFIEGFWKGGNIEGFTDDTGHAYFTTADDYESWRKLWISIPTLGKNYGPFEIGGGSYTVTLD
jgi:hypothetical protein